MKRLGAASMTISVSDTDGFKVVHGTSGETLVHLSPDNVSTTAWNKMWEAIHNIETDGYLAWRRKNPDSDIAEYIATNPKNS